LIIPSLIIVRGVEKKFQKNDSVIIAVEEQGGVKNLQVKRIGL